MDFEDYWRNGCFGKYHDIYAKNLADKFYNAGQQSKQEEVNKLQEEIDALQQQNQRLAMRLDVIHGALQKQIDLIVELKNDT